MESVVHSILFYLDLRTFGAVLHFIQAAPELQMYLKDDALWTQLSKVHFGGPRSPEMTVEPLPSQNRKWPWTSRERTCVQLQEFLQSMDDLTRFDEVVSVVAGDIQHVNAVDGQPLDGIVFPTNPNLTNFHIGAAAAVFKRAGPGLEQFVNDPSFQGARPIGSAVVTPAFDAGVDKLIHCVGPSIMMADCFELLSLTYENAMNAVLREDLQCVVMASISTGNLGILPEEGGPVAIRAIKMFLGRTGWRGKVAIVCNDESVLRAFTTAKNTSMRDFNVLLPLPENNEAIWHG